MVVEKRSRTLSGLLITERSVVSIVFFLLHIDFETQYLFCTLNRETTSKHSSLILKNLKQKPKINSQSIEPLPHLHQAMRAVSSIHSQTITSRAHSISAEYRWSRQSFR